MIATTRGPAATDPHRAVHDYRRPADLAAAVAGHDVLLVTPRRSPRRSGRRAAATGLLRPRRESTSTWPRRHPPRPGHQRARRDAQAVAKLTMTFALMPSTASLAARYLTGGRPLGGGTYEGRQFMSSKAASMTSLVGLGRVGEEVAARGALAGHLRYDRPAAPSPGRDHRRARQLLAAGPGLGPRPGHGRRVAHVRRGRVRPHAAAYPVDLGAKSLVDEDTLSRTLAGACSASASARRGAAAAGREPPPLLDLRNMIITPHISSTSPSETLRRRAIHRGRSR